MICDAKVPELLEVLMKVALQRIGGRLLKLDNKKWVIRPFLIAEDRDVGDTLLLVEDYPLFFLSSYIIFVKGVHEDQIDEGSDLCLLVKSSLVTP